MNIKLGLRIKAGDAGGATPPEPETTALLARAASAPTEALAALINTTIKGLKDDGIFALGDCLYIRGVHEQTLALQNWIKNAHNCTLVGVPVFTPKVGFTGGAGKAIKLNYIPGTDAVNYGLGNGCISYMHKAMSGTNLDYPFGAGFGGLSCYGIFYLAANERIVMDGGGAYLAGPDLSADDYVAYVRDGGFVQGYLNGAVFGLNTVNAAAAALVNVTLAELCFNSGNPFTQGGKYDGTVSYFWIGAKMTAPQVLALYTRIKYFYDNVGGTF